MTSVGVVERVRRANAPPPPDNSVTFRVATTIAVLNGIVACESVGEISTVLALGAMVAVCAGMTFSYVTRSRPWQWIKIILALAVLAVFVNFVSEILNAAHTGQLTSIELPLAGLFTWVQIVHAFDVPARRDLLLFSIAAAAALVTIAGAQAVSQGFLIFVAIWLVSTLIGLSCAWRSMTSGRGPLPAAALMGCLALILAIALALLVALPSPWAAQNLTLPASLTSHLPLAGSGIVNGSGADPTEPAQAGKPGGKIGVGGYLGFDGPLQTADRASLGNQVIMRVRAERPGYFLGMTYDTWNGQSWIESDNQHGTHVIDGGSPFSIPPRAFPGPQLTANVQTFYVEQPLPNLLFATADPVQVYFPSHTLILGGDGSIRTPVAITPGTVYTVVSADDEEPSSVLANDRGSLSRSERRSPQVQNALQLPNPYRRVKALASSIVAKAHAVTIEAKVVALENWMGSHTQYTTDIPPLLPGQDTVNQFLFGSRKGYCEQISTSLAVMLRTLGIPAREAIGYVPGPFDPLSDMYEIEAKDAHAWVQVFLPKYGWQSFDPTADVPLAPPNAGAVLFHDLLDELAALPWVPIGSVAGAAAIGYWAVVWDRRRRRRPATWAGLMALRIERLGARAGVVRNSSETLAEFGRRLEGVRPGHGVSEATTILEESAYGPQSGTGANGRVEAAIAALKENVPRFRRARARPQPAR